MDTSRGEMSDRVRAATPYQSGGRTRQKERTRTALVDALRQLMAAGTAPSVEQVAEAAGVSRTTAYRYFPDHHALLLAAYPQTGYRSLLGENPPHRVVDRVGRVLDGQLAIIRDWEPQLRAALWTALRPGADRPVLRGGRAIGWFEDALSPLLRTWTPAQVHDLAVRLRAVAGIETWVWLRDVAGLSDASAEDAVRTNVRAILAAALAEAPTGSSSTAVGQVCQ